MTGKELVKKFEGCKLQAYKCPAGIWTIGYGHTQGVKEGDVITQSRAEALFERDYKDAEDQVKKTVKVPLTENQLGALTSFVFNLGIDKLRSSTLLRLFNEGKTELASNEFDRWVYSNGKKLNGLIDRRRAEKQLFKIA